MIYAASDIHGRWEKYCALLERLSHEDPDYTLYLLGAKCQICIYI